MSGQIFSSSKKQSPKCIDCKKRSTNENSLHCFECDSKFIEDMKNTKSGIIHTKRLEDGKKTRAKLKKKKIDLRRF